MKTLKLFFRHQQNTSESISIKRLLNILSGITLFISIYLEYTINFHRKCAHIDILLSDNFPTLLHKLDADIIKAINPSIVTPSLTIIFISLTLLGGSIFLMGYVISIALKGEFRDALLFLTALLISMALSYSLKIAIDRPRPFYTISGTIPLECSLSPSFPSGHTAKFAALTGLYFEANARYRYVYLVLSLLVGFSRIYLGVHYPLDIAVGWILGYIIGFYVSRGLKGNIASLLGTKVAV